MYILKEQNFYSVQKHEPAWALLLIRLDVMTEECGYFQQDDAPNWFLEPDDNVTVLGFLYW